MVSDVLVNWHRRWQTGVALIFRRRCLCFPFFLFLSCTSSHLCSEPPAAEEIISDNRIRTICISPLRERSYHCTAHSDSWGQGQMGALIGPVKAPNTPLWSQLTAIGWLFISNRIAVDPLAEGLEFLGFFFSRSYMCCESGPRKRKVLKMCSKPQSTSKYQDWGNIPSHIRRDFFFFFFHDRSKILSIQAFPGSRIPWNPLVLGFGSHWKTRLTVI